MRKKSKSGSESESLVDKDDNEESEVDEIHGKFYFFIYILGQCLYP